MTDHTIHHLMVFRNKAERIYPFLQDVVAFIERHIPEKTDQIIFKSRVIITELLTNSIKHAFAEPIGIELFISPQSFIIKKIDMGEPLYFTGIENRWPLTNPVESSLLIYSDTLNGLFAKVTSPYSVSFYTETYFDDDNNHADISEHYGLLIISRASNDFTYLYNPKSQQNIFTVTISLD